MQVRCVQMPFSLGPTPKVGEYYEALVLNELDLSIDGFAQSFPFWCFVPSTNINDLADIAHGIAHVPLVIDQLDVETVKAYRR